MSRTTKILKSSVISIVILCIAFSMYSIFTDSINFQLSQAIGWIGLGTLNLYTAYSVHKKGHKSLTILNTFTAILFYINAFARLFRFFS